MNVNETWLDNDNLLNLNWQDAYIRSYFCFVYHIGANVYYFPKSNLEFIYIIIILLITVLTFAYIIGMVGNIIESITRDSKDFKDCMDTINEYS